MRLIIMLLLFTSCDKITAKVTNEDPMASFTFRGYVSQEIELHIKPMPTTWAILPVPTPFYASKPKAITAEKEPTP